MNTAEVEKACAERLDHYETKLSHQISGAGQ